MPEFSRIYRISTAKMEDEVLSHAYEASFARGKKSGLSFGFYQNDVANNKKARTAFEQLLVASGEFDREAARHVLEIAATPGIHAKKFTPEELTKINRALSCPAGREIVRGADEVQLQTLDRYVSQVISAANRNSQGLGVFHPTHPDHEKAMVLTAAWINRTDPPSTILEFVSGKSTTLNGNTLQLQTAPSLEDLKQYFKSTQQFSHESFENWDARADRALTYAKAQVQVQTQNLEPTLPLFSLETLFDQGTCQTYTVKSGDTMWKIAKQHGLALNALLVANRYYIGDPNFIRPGDTIYLPSLNCLNKTDPDKHDDIPRVPLKNMYPQALPPLALPQPPRDPLAFDLNRDGIIETVALTQDLHFDFNGDGFKETTTWVGKNDGLLVLDRDQNGSIDDGRELFGGDTILNSGRLADNGFLALKELDSNQSPDQVIDDKDACFSALRIWKDANQNAIAEPNELHCLSDLGIGSIHLSYQPSDHVDKNQIAHRELGTFTWMDGYPGKIACLWFNVDKRLTIPAEHAQETLEIPEDIQRLPNVRGYGTVRSLHEAMTLDKSGELKAMVKAYVNATHTTEITHLLHEIIFLWTGQSGIDMSARGEHIDARQLGALEALCGEKLPIQAPNRTYAQVLKQQYQDVVGTIYYQLSSQHPWNWLFEQIRFAEDPQTLQVNADFSAFIPHCQIAFQYLSREDAAAVLLHQMRMCYGVRPFDKTVLLQFYDHLYPALKTLSPETLEIVFTNRFTSLSNESDTVGCNDFITNNPRNHFLNGLYGDDTLKGCNDFDMLFGGPGNDKLYGAGGNDGLFGGMGDDILEGGDGADVLSGNSGNDILKGGMGSDTYRFGRGSGIDTIIEDQSAPGDIDVLKFAPDVLNDQLWFRQVDNNLEISVIGTNAKITVQDWALDKAHHIEQFKTDDGSALLESQFDALISAMAAFAPPSMGETTLSPNYQTALAPILATSWENGLR